MLGSYRVTAQLEASRVVLIVENVKRELAIINRLTPNQYFIVEGMKLDFGSTRPWGSLSL
jgi:hypothetical protein